MRGRKGHAPGFRGVREQNVRWGNVPVGAFGEYSQPAIRSTTPEKSLEIACNEA